MLTKEGIEKLKNHGNGDLAELMANKNDNKTITFILENLGYLPKNFDSSILLPLIEHENPKIRLLAAKNIAKLNKIEHLELLWDSFNKETDTSARREIVSAIGRLRKKQNKPYLFQILQDEDPKVVCQAIRGLLTYSDDILVERKLKPLLNHPNEMIQAIIYKEFFAVKIKNASQKHKMKEKIKSVDNFLNKIVCGDALEIMRQMPDKSIDLVVTSPPYNLKNSTGNGMKAGTKSGRWANNPLQNGYAHHNDEMPHDEYVSWQIECLSEAMRLLKDDGAIFYNHKRRVQGGIMQDRDDIVKGFPVRQIIIWKRSGGFNFNPGYFVPSYEVIYLICKPKFKLAPKKNGYTDVWEFPQERKNKHPAPYPLALPYRCIESTNAQIILDPFSGSGTTSVAAKQLNRNYIGIEISPEYCEMADNRLNETFFIPNKENSLFDIKK